MSQRHPRTTRPRGPRTVAALASATLAATSALIAPVASTPATPQPVAVAAAATCAAANGTALRTTPATYDKTVSLTFDDGPGEWTPDVLDALAESGVRATFFVVGNNVRRHPEIARRIVREGHVIANHTYTHPQKTAGSVPYGNFDSLSTALQRDQLDRTTNIITSTTGVAPCYFRGPGGWHWSRTTQDETKARKLTIAHWTLSSGDTGQAKTTTSASTAKIVSASTTSNKHPIVLFHDGPAAHDSRDGKAGALNRGNTVAALPKIIAHYKKNGYVFTDPRGKKLPTGKPKVTPAPASLGERVFAYSSTSGAHGVLEVSGTGTDRGLATGTSEPGWDVVVPVEIDGTPGDELLFYNPAEGRRTIADVTSTGALRTMSSGAWSKGWDVLVPVETDGTVGDELLVYSSVNGRRWILDVSKTGSTSALQGGGWSKGWDVVVPVETDGTTGSELVTYNSATGRRWLLDLSRSGGTRAISGGTWSKGWDVVTGVRRPGASTESLLFYNTRNGRELVLQIGSTGSLKQLSSRATATGWTGVLALELDRSAGDEIVHYRRSDGSVSLSDLSSRGVLGGEVTNTWPSGRDVVVPVDVPGR